MRYTTDLIEMPNLKNYAAGTWYFGYKGWVADQHRWSNCDSDRRCDGRCVGNAK